MGDISSKEIGYCSPFFFKIVVFLKQLIIYVGQSVYPMNKRFIFVFCEEILGSADLNEDLSDYVLMNEKVQTGF